ncbi:hypothetical protein TCAL_06307 [Tigriopus californicus]|uniref:Major facilitator superfamily (MFS) profile domain-containing protein n=1 Tax=Tigriopus californicus TaxID=6832 RepID=A0A553PSY7_TIGCA|nr:organic cation transporter protein-like [Tigriopus californicus]TRY80790.1 hypothetical protein TCAL_06307 [Tigriopus californicus]
MDFDLIFESIGEFGWQQKKYVFIILMLNGYSSWHMLQYSFVGYQMPFTCLALDQDTPYHNQCPGNSAGKCEKIEFDTSKESTVVSEWTLVCDQAHLGPMVMSVFMLGVLIGALVMGILADAFGRKKTLILAFTCMLISNFVSGHCIDFRWYLSSRFVDGFFTSGNILVSFVLSNEIIGASIRGPLGTLLQSFFALGIMLFACVARFVTNWRSLTLLTSAIGLPLIVTIGYLPESPRWLYANGHPKRAIDVVKTIAENNGTKLNPKHISKEESTEFGQNEARVGVTSLLTVSSLRRITLIQIFSWFVNSMTYYGLTIAAAGTGDRYQSTFMSGFVELFAYALTYTFLPKLGRRVTLCGFMVLGGLPLTLLLVLPNGEWLVYAIAMWSKTCIAGSFAVAYIHSGEIFPTCIRNSAMGLVSMAARAGGIASPYVAEMRGEAVPNLHLVVFGLATLSSGLLNTRLPETQDLPLPDTLEELTERLEMTTPDSKTRYQPLKTLNNDINSETFVPV